MKYLFFLIIFNFSLSQEKETLYLNSSCFLINEINDNKQFELFFTVKSDNFYKWDVYKFLLFKDSIDNNYSINDLGIKITSDKLDVKNIDFFNNMNNCQIHELLNNCKIVIVKEITRENEKTNYKVWNINYNGTIRNIIYNFSTSFDKAVN